MDKNYNYEVYNSFIQKNFPLSVYVTSEENEIKRTYYFTINKLIEILLIYKETNLFSENSLLTIEEIKILLNKLLLYIPLNDSFLLSSIIRALAEKYLKLIISLTESSITVEELSDLRFSEIKNKIKDDEKLKNYLEEIKIGYTIFNDHSQIIHDKHKTLQNLTFLDEQISRTTVDINRYTRILNNFWKLEFKPILELSGATNQDFSIAHKTRFKLFLSKNEFEYVSFL